MTRRSAIFAGMSAAAAVTLSGCGYHLAGQASILPKEIHTIAVPAFGNTTTQYKLADYLSQAVTRELIARTHYAIVADAKQADASLVGTVANMFQSGTVFDPTTGRGTGAQIIVIIQLRIYDRDGKIIFERPNLEYRERYEISVDPKQYFDESQTAMQRLSQDVARSIVSAILEAF